MTRASALVYASTKWTIPEQVKLEGTSEPWLVPSHSVKSDLELADPEVHRTLFRSFVRVRNAETALNWCERFGMPFGAPDEPISLMDVQALAETLRWLLLLHKYARENMLIPLEKHLRIYGTDELRRNYPSLLGEFYDSQNLATDSDPVYVIMKKSEARETGVYAVNFGNSIADELSEEDLWQAYRPEELEDDPLFAVKAARDYLARAMNWLLIDLHPTLEVVGETLRPSLRIGTPWLAIAFALYKEMTTIRAVWLIVKVWRAYFGMIN